MTSFGPDRLGKYLAGTSGAPPRAELVRAIRLDLDGPRPAFRGDALDLGCGPGREARALIEAGFDVLAIDLHESMVEATRSLAGPLAESRGRRLEVVCSRIEDALAALPAARFRLVHAGFVLPFVAAAELPALMANLARVTQPGGLFSGQLFGPDDSFLAESPPGSMNSHPPSELQSLFAGFEILEREEVNRAGLIGRGEAKWWHVHHVIARRL